MRKETTRQIAEAGVTSLLAVARWSLQVAGAAFALCLFYLSYVLFSGQLQHVTESGVRNLHTLGLVLCVSGAVATASLALLTLEEVYLSVISGTLGLALLFGTPVMVSAYAKGTAPALQAAVDALNRWGTTAGKLIILIVGLRVIYEIYLQMATSEERKTRKEKEKHEEAARLRVAEKPKHKYSESMAARCWDMPFCHEAVREMCPAFKAHKTCWRFGRGCNCDSDLVESMIRSRAPMAKADTEGEYIRSDLQADVRRARGERTIPCTKCPIYVEHQRRKFKTLTPIVSFATIVALVVFYKPLAGLYSTVAGAIASAASGAALGENAGNVEYWRQYLDNPQLQGAFVVILGLFILTWVLKTAEWLILDKKVL